jgi:hypothetical protein
VDLDRGARSGSRGRSWRDRGSGLTSLGGDGGLGLAFPDALNDSEIHLLSAADEFF